MIRNEGLERERDVVMVVGACAILATVDVGRAMAIAPQHASALCRGFARAPAPSRAPELHVAGRNTRCARGAPGT
jgi:hypothetical protein